MKVHTFAELLASRRYGPRRVVLLILALFVFGNLQASEQVDAAYLTGIVEAHAKEVASQPGVALEVEARLDSRINMPGCGQAPKLGVHSQTMTAMSVMVSCQGPQAWSLYVPVKMRKTATVIVLAMNLGRGTALESQHLALQSRELNKLSSGYFLKINDVLGKELKRPMQAGMPVTSTDVQAPDVIKRGDTVQLVARSGQIEVRTKGKALSSAGIDERIKVKNMSTRRLVDGYVSAEGMVRVGH